MIYNGYNLNAVAPIVDSLNALKDSPFYSSKLEQVVAKVVATMAFYSVNNSATHLWGGRWRGGGEIDPNIILVMSQTLSDKAQKDYFEKLYLLSRSTKVSAEELAKDAAKLNQKLPVDYSLLNGFLVLNHAASAVYRQDRWMFTVKGGKKGYNTNEIYGTSKGANSMGRYLRYGAYQITSQGGDSPNHKDSGFYIPTDNNMGWDFNFIPGTTTRVIPQEALRSHFAVEEILTDESFCGSTTMDKDYGIFAMSLKEELPGESDFRRIGPIKQYLGSEEYDRRILSGRYDTTFRAYKSYFVMNDYILCLGSGISSQDDKHDVVTTLNQNYLSDDKLKSFTLNGEATTQYPLAEELTGATSFIDAYKNGFFIPQTNDLLVVNRHLVDSYNYSHWIESQNPVSASEWEKTKVDSIGNNELFFINHGKKPNNSSYEYFMQIDTSSDKFDKLISRYNQGLLYKIVQQDNTAHIVKDISKDIYSFAIFDAKNFAGNEIVKSTSRPILMMVKDEDNTHRKITVCDPDFAEYIDYAKISSKPTFVNLEINGLWSLDTPNPKVKLKHSQNSTILTIECSNAISEVIALNR